ncbi:endonuclease/exonuclease/phosphatase family protein [Geodermatophilus sp. SYSU D00965]
MTRPAPGPGRPPTRLRLATFNTHHAVGDDGRHDLARLAKVVAAVDADLVCLQEVDRRYSDRSEDVDQALLLSEALDMELAWGPAIDEPRGDEKTMRRQYGNALLSRLPIRSSAVHRLPGDGEPRSALRVQVALPEGALWVTTTHLSTRPTEQRAAQAEALARLHADPAEAAVLVGDFNAEPDAPELAALRDRFTDAWELARDRDDRAGWKFWRHDEGHTHPARRPHKRIDHVWVTPGIGVATARVLDGAGASDHLPLVVDLELPAVV